MRSFNKLMAGMAAAAAFVIAGGITLVRAADLGGNCCADLEQRVAELEALSAKKGNRKVSLTVYGQVNQAVLWVDAAGASDTTITNNGNAQTRFGFTGETKFGPGWSAGYSLEIGTAVASYTGSASYGLGIRHSALFVKNDTAGTVWLGKTSTATDGIVEIDLTNTNVASTRLSLEPLSTSYLNGMNLPFDGNREEVLRWVSPLFAGFTASASWSANRNDAWDVALRYANEFDGQVRIAAGVGYRTEDDLASTGKAKTFTASGSILHIPTGLFLNGSYGDMQGATASTTLPIADIRAWHLQTGIERKWFDPGLTTFYGEFAKLESRNGAGSTDLWGFGAVQAIDAAAMHLYVGYRNYQDLDVQTLTAGAVIKF